MFVHLDYQSIETINYSLYHKQENIIDINNLGDTYNIWKQTSTSDVFVRLDFNEEMDIKGLFMSGAAG